jgi:hypothetical protein
MFKAMRILSGLPVNPLGVGNRKGTFLEYFKGFDKVAAVRGIFGEKTTEVLSHLTVEFTLLRGYMYVDGDDGHLVVSRAYLNSGDKTDIYLDLIHELCHVKQFMDGKQLFDENYSYVDRPTEIEAYRYCVQEAQRLGLGDERILHYLRTEWLTEGELCRLASNIGLKS